MPKFKFSEITLHLCAPLCPTQFAATITREIDDLAYGMVAFLFPQIRATMSESDFCTRIAQACVLLAQAVPVSIPTLNHDYIADLFQSPPEGGKERLPVTQAQAWLYNFLVYGHDHHESDGMALDQHGLRILQLHRYVAELEGQPLRPYVLDHFGRAG